MRFALFAVALVACNAPRGETASSSQAVACASDATGIDARDLVEERLGATLVRTAWSPLGNHHPAARFVLRRAGRAIDLGDATAAILVDGGAAVVRVDGTLERFDARSCPRAIASSALPDLAASPDGRTFAFVQSFGAGTALSVYRDGSTRRVASAYAEADRPIFVDDRTLLFVGAARPGVSTFHRVSLDDEVPHPLAIDGIPASREGYVVANGVVRFHDGEIFRSGAIR